ncbi:MAG TPA: pyruvate dehydrogenase (acetyl-transferring) E1 component subunit alpha, partial [Homoserinimonas sp.]|nr:pyruvate dehydrogenase (acetyl-transferring) E1 component subunit alpha [Homoserinimonas sp.]
MLRATNVPEATTDLNLLGHPEDLIQLLTPAGERVTDPSYENWVADVTDEQLVSLYEDMVVVRRIDTEATALQR